MTGLKRRLYLDRPGLNVVFKEWEIAVLEYLDGRSYHLTTAEVHTYVTEFEPRQVSRASVIGFLQSMAKAGLIDNTTGTGKGGVHEKYKLKYDLAKFYRSTQRMILEQIEEAFKDVTD